MADKPNPETRKVFSTSDHWIGGSIPGVPGAAQGTWRTDLTPDEVATIDGRIQQVCGVAPGQAVIGCADLAKRGMRSCVPEKSSAKGTVTPSSLAQLNTLKGTNVDWSAIAGWEGGQFKEPYIPWGPAFALVDNPAVPAFQGLLSNIQSMAAANVPMAAQSAAALEQAIKNIPPYSVRPVVRNGKIVALDGAGNVPNNNSGVTVATGVDIGQQDKDGFIKGLRDLAKDLYKDPEALKAANADIDDFAAKYGDFFGKKQAAACAALLKAIADGKNLALSQSQVDLLDLYAHKDHLTGTMGQIGGTAFKALGQAEQTVLFSRHYNAGSVKDPYLSDAVKGDWTAFGQHLGASTNDRIKKESQYFNSHYVAPPSATGPTGPTGPAATGPTGPAATGPTGPAATGPTGGHG